MIKKIQLEETFFVVDNSDKKYIERQYHLKGDTCLSGKSCHATQIGKMLFSRKEIFFGSFLLEQVWAIFFHLGTSSYFYVSILCVHHISV